jgi:hypothetical protein
MHGVSCQNIHQDYGLGHAGNQPLLKQICFMTFFIEASEDHLTNRRKQRMAEIDQ